jgi:hypothetical protein
LANAFLAKPVQGLEKTRALHEQLTITRSLRCICGFPMVKKLPPESALSRAFEEFARMGVAERTHEALIKETLGDKLIGHLSRDATAIEARERPQPKDKKNPRGQARRNKTFALPSARTDTCHVPLIDHNPPGGEKIEFEPPDAVRYNKRSVTERINAQLKDEFGGRNVWVRGHLKVKGHLMFGILALSVDPMRLLC